MKERIVFLDYMRVIACFMVIMVHSCEFFFIDGPRIGIRSMYDGFWVSVIDSAFRCSVPLFVMISAYLQFPVTGSVSRFLGRRFSRVVVPFVIWSLLYASFPYLWGDMTGTDVKASLLRLAYNFNDASGHMWFIYMLIGLYLVFPVISPWIERVSRRGELAFLILWFASTFFPYLRDCVGDVYGECYWNEYNMLWYFSGFIGYVVLAHFVRRRLEWSVRRRVVAGALLYAAGYYVTASIWYGRIPVATTLQQLELSWRFCTPNVVAMSLGAFLLIEAAFSKASSNKMITAISARSYGIYLMHIFVLTWVFRLIGGMFATPVTIGLVGAATFIVCVVLTWVLSKLPGSRFIIG